MNNISCRLSDEYSCVALVTVFKNINIDPNVLHKQEWGEGERFVSSNTIKTLKREIESSIDNIEDLYPYDFLIKLGRIPTDPYSLFMDKNGSSIREEFKDLLEVFYAAIVLREELTWLNKQKSIDIINSRLYELYSVKYTVYITICKSVDIDHSTYRIIHINKLT